MTRKSRPNQIAINDDESVNDFEIRKAEQTRFLHMEKIDLDTISNLFDAYATKKTYAAGFFNLALIATNFTQLKHLLTMDQTTLFCVLNISIMTFVCISLLLQIVVGIVLIYLARSGEFIEEQQRAKLIRQNNAVTFLIVAISIINVFINVFLNVTI